jgi:transcriptional regulator with XRE-family HTH domain
MLRKDTELDGQIGQRLAQLRQAVGLSQVALAEYLHINKRTLCSYEKGVRRVPIELLPKIAEQLRVSCDDLLASTGTRVDRRTADSRLMKRFQMVATLPPEKRQTVVRVLDTLLADAK